MIRNLAPLKSSTSDTNSLLDIQRESYTDDRRDDVNYPTLLSLRLR